ncbi:MFS transporter [Chloroflexota bacterium]
MSSPLGIQNKLFYGWVVVAAFLVIGTIMHGSVNSFGVFFKSLESQFGLTRAATSMVFSTAMFLGCVLGILGGMALDKYGPRMLMLLMGLFTGLGLILASQTSASWQLFLTYSLLLPIGTGSIFTVMMATVLRWFDKKRGLALGVAGSGIGLGMVLIAPFATYLITSFGWRMAFIIIGLIAWLIVIPLSRLLRKGPSEIGALPDGKKTGSVKIIIEEPEPENRTQLAGFSLLQASRTRSFWIFSTIKLLLSFCYLLVLTHIVPHVMDIGIPAIQAATILSLAGVCMIAGRLIIGRVSDIVGRKSAAMTCSLILAGAMIWLTWSQDLWMFYVFGAVYGFCRGGLDPPITALIGDTFGLRSIGVIMGTINIAWGIGSAIGPAVGGFIFDVSESYFMAFLAGALAMFISAVLVALIRQETTSYTGKGLGHFTS